MRQKANPKPAAGSARRGQRGSSLPAALCGFVGRLALLAVILACLPVPLAHLFGCQMYNVVSGSMEPAIPVGSAVYVKPADPAEIAPGEVIAFQSGGSVVTHRVVQNDPAEEQLVTKGDANAQPDLRPVRYREVLGRVVRRVPMLGGLISSYTDGTGRSYLIALALAGALLSLVGSWMGRRAKAAPGPGTQAPGSPGTQTAGAPGSPGAQTPGGNAPDAPGAPPESDTATAALAAARASIQRGRRLRRILMGVLAAVLLLSLGAVLFLRWQAARQRQFYEDTAQEYTQTAPTQPPKEEQPPIAVDFDALCAANSDVTGWLYCEDTPINYPVMQGETNDDYLRRDAEKQYSNAGSIFIEELNRRGLIDQNIIIYGHNMGDGSMFACLSQWQDQAFFDEHPVMWLLTPQQDYKVLLFSAYPTTAVSDSYTIYIGTGEPFDEYLKKMASQSVVEADVELDGEAKYILLSTCATSYGTDLDRNVLHGMLQPVGAPKG